MNLPKKSHYFISKKLYSFSIEKKEIWADGMAVLQASKRLHK